MNLVTSRPVKCSMTPIPIIDLFAGPGGLGEGFASLKAGGNSVFRIGLSIEKDPVAHRTLTLRSVFRQLRSRPAVRHYYDYIAGRITESAFRAVPEVAEAFAHATEEARCIELGKTDPKIVDREIRAVLGNSKQWILIGGPPCQAYSLAGRARRTQDKAFDQDEKHFLYREYIRIIQVHRPTVFVMENVKGLLSSSHSGKSMFNRIVGDLSSPRDGLEYDIRSIVKDGHGVDLDPEDYVIASEKYGVPQCRHRLILLGVRKDLPDVRQRLLKPAAEPVSVKAAIGDLPRIRSRLSDKSDSPSAWSDVLTRAPDLIRGWGTQNESRVSELMSSAATGSSKLTGSGGKFCKVAGARRATGDGFTNWVHDDHLGGVCQHEARSHMPSDLARYLFAASFSKLNRYSPRLDIFPAKLLPEHKSAKKTDGSAMPFLDRFRVQCENEPSTTIVSHIAKDGHYYIHYDPEQCRSLTVREAARLQTFPDNYFFEGNRTEQYTQVGNAVPPLLAFQIAKVVAALLTKLNLHAAPNFADKARR
jgi:DNA (cytosine-5)-methyltransferase 1